MDLTPPLSSDEKIEHFLALCHKKKYPAKTAIVNSGDISQSLVYMIDGSACVIAQDEDGHEIIVAYLNSGQFFG